MPSLNPLKKLLICTGWIIPFGCAALYSDVALSDDMLELKLRGFMTGYGVYASQDEPAGIKYRSADLRRATEFTLSAEMKLDDGLVAGASMELLGDRFDANQVQESYIYFAGDWGRINLGEEDGIAYLLQVTAPSGDDRIDGARPKIGAFGATSLGGTIRYGHSDFGRANKLTYMTPLLGGFQAGASFTPSPSEGDLDGVAASAVANSIGTNTKNAWELAARHTEAIDDVRVTVGLGYSHGAQEHIAAGESDRQRSNAGITVSWHELQVGAVFGVTNNAGEKDDTETRVIGLKYTYGPYAVGASYLNQSNENATFEEDIDRWTVGLVYDVGSGLTFRGAFQHQAVENLSGVDAADREGSLFAIGSQLTF